ncbi:hypothetical protein [Kitasatospora sp. Root107]|uniref:hypothetical protein n=1 Tax=Kitasatospora sp. Root107 TaxID=1736424 RepID=UPI0012F73D57|nr:hypothetical protein [Kitasatospora sp. Root107]
MVVLGLERGGQGEHPLPLGSARVERPQLHRLEDLGGVLAGVDPQPVHRRLPRRLLGAVQPGLASRTLAGVGVRHDGVVLLPRPLGAQLCDPADHAGVVGGQGPQDAPDGAERAGFDLVVGLGLHRLSGVGDLRRVGGGGVVADLVVGR